MSLVYSTKTEIIPSDSMYARMAEIKEELESLPSIDHSLKHLSDVCEDSLNVEWENEYGRYWESFISEKELYTALTANEARNAQYEKQIDLQEELSTLDMKMMDMIYYSDQYND